jgi:hypothetical protein
MKKLRAAHKFTKAISKAVDTIARQVISRFADRGTDGREEDISSQLVAEITGHLLEEIKKRICEIRVNGIEFDAVIYKKKTENAVGADIAGAVTYNGFGQNQTKVFLVQSKVAKSAKKAKGNKIRIKARDPRLLKQCENMLKITPAAFVFVYSEFGVHVIPAVEIVVSGKSVIDTNVLYYKELGDFYEEVYKCFIGDSALGRAYRDDEMMREICDNLVSEQALAISITKQNSSLTHSSGGMMI